jgi:membrane-associated phospholipid phosphatase
MEEYLQKLITEPLMFIGYLSGRITFIIIVSYFLYYQKFFWIFPYVFLYVINTGIIIWLQKIWKDPRPTNGIQFMDDEFHNKDAYGMPSGHTQTIFFSLVFFYMITRSIYWLIIMCFIAGCTISQRLIYRKHTILQIIVGGILGSLYGYYAYLFINDYKKNGYLIYNNVSK